jgi:FkbM family methyltransferase
MKLTNVRRAFQDSVKSHKLLVNWPAVVGARVLRKPKPDRLQFRNGVVLTGPKPDVLNWLYYEVWTNQTYTPSGYEIQSGDTVIDVGANIGLFTAFAASSASDVKVYSFEPFASNFAWLRKNVEDSGLTNVRVFQQAVAGSPGQKPFFIDPENCMFHSLVCDQSFDGQKRTHEMVTCTTLDEIFKENRIKCCHLLKLDCEGAEFEILASSSPESLNRVRKVVGECHANYTAESLCRLLESHAFRVDYCQSSIFRATNTAPLES